MGLVTCVASRGDPWFLSIQLSSSLRESLQAWATTCSEPRSHLVDSTKASLRRDGSARAYRLLCGRVWCTSASADGRSVPSVSPFATFDALSLRGGRGSAARFSNRFTLSTAYERDSMTPEVDCIVRGHRAPHALLDKKRSDTPGNCEPFAQSEAECNSSRRMIGLLLEKLFSRRYPLRFLKPSGPADSLLYRCVFLGTLAIGRAFVFALSQAKGASELRRSGTERPNNHAKNPVDVASIHHRRASPGSAAKVESMLGDLCAVNETGPQRPGYFLTHGLNRAAVRNKAENNVE